MEFKVFKNENNKILKEYWLTQSEWDALDKTTVQEGDIYHIVGTIDKGDLSADVNASLAKADNSLQKPTATLAKESFVKVGIDGTQKFDESSYAALDADKTNTFYSANTFNRPVKLAKDTSYVEYGEQSSYKFRDNSKENAVATLNDLIEDDAKTYIIFKGINFPGNNSFQVDKGAVIDWGDGTIQTVTGDPYETVSHTYSGESLYRIVISNLLSISNGAFSDCLGLLDFKLGSTVTNIGGAAFKGTSLSSVTIPKTITQMELLSIFAQCTNLKTVRVLSETPLTVQPEIFENSPIEKIIVPKSAVNAYKSAAGWSTYADKIVYEVDSSDISDTSNFAKLSGNNTFTGTNTFKTENSSTLYRTLINQNGVSVGGGPGRIELDVCYGYNSILRLNDTNIYTYVFPNKSGTLATIEDLTAQFGALNIQNGSGIKSIQQGADPKYNGVIKAASKNPYAKVLYPELTDAEPIGAIGDYAASFGGNSSVQAKRGIGGGTSSVTKGAYSQSLGDNTVTTPKASDSTAIGYQTTTDAPGAFTHGSFTVVMSQKYIEGMFDPSTKPGQGGSGQPTEPGTTPADTLEMDTRRGEAASAGGFNSYSSGFAAEVDGVSNVADGHISKSSGRSNRSWSYLSKTDGKNSVVKPDQTNENATGEGSWANGDNIQIIGAKYAYSGGSNNIVFAGADNSFSYGEGLQVKHKNQTVIGQYNDNNQDDIFEIGVGTSNLRKTSFRATRDGKVYYRDFEVSNLKATNDAIVSLDNKLTPKITGNTTEITKLWSTLRDTNTNLNRLNETKQATLISGTNIKTINGNSLLGSGDLTIAGGGGDVTAAGNNTFTGSNTFAKSVTFAHGITNRSSMIISSTGATDPTKPAPYAIYNYGTITLKASGVTGADKVRTLTLPTSASGTLALTSDIPIKSASLDGTTLNITLA